MWVATKSLDTLCFHKVSHIVDSVELGKRPELVDGGLRRSLVLQPDQEEPQDYDDRVLGSEDFVAALWNSGCLALSIDWQGEVSLQFHI